MTKLFYISIFALILASASSAYPSEFILEAYGDSVTAGLLSNTNISKNPDYYYVSRVLSDLAMFTLTENRKYLAPHEHRSLAWPNLIAPKLARGGETVQVRNYALSGARSMHLKHQVQSAATVPSGARVIAFFFIGNNNLCEKEGLAPNEVGSKFYREVREALTLWEGRHKGGVAYLMPIAEIYKIFPLLEKQQWYQGNGQTRAYTCVQSWTRLFPYCPSFYRLYKNGQIEQELVPRITSMNGRLNQLAREMSLNSSSNAYRFVIPLKPVEFEKHYFAVDCYHLSEEGQIAVARTVLDSLTYSP